MASAVVVGLMSGTSLDGISAAVARFRDANDGRIDVDLLAYTSRAYSSAERTRVRHSAAALPPSTVASISTSEAGWLMPRSGSWLRRE